jgi:hypothetical protein
MSTGTKGFFEKNSQNELFPKKMVESENSWCYKKVRLKSFPMNGHVSMF